MSNAILSASNSPTLSLDSIQLNEENPRTLTDARFSQLVKSLEEFPEMLALRPLVLDETNTVLGGNMRLRAKSHLLALSARAKKKRIEQLIAGRVEAQGWAPDGPEASAHRETLDFLYNSPYVPVAFALGLTPEQKREFIIKDNGSFGEWDFDALANGNWGDSATLNDWGMDVPKDWDATPVVVDEISLPNNDAPAFKTMSFVLSDLQAQDVETALAMVKEQYGEALDGTGNENANGNALAYIVANFLSQHNSEPEDDDASGTDLD